MGFAAPGPLSCLLDRPVHRAALGYGAALDVPSRKRSSSSVSTPGGTQVALKADKLKS